MTEPPRHLTFRTDRGDARLRLDEVLARHVTQVTRMSSRLAQQWIATGAVTVDAALATQADARVPAGAHVDVSLPPDTVMRMRPAPEPGDLTVVYQDEWMLVADKPPGLVVHPSYKQQHGTLLNRVMWHVRETASSIPGILTRLDKDTSGLVVIALTPEVHAALQRSANAGRVHKTYVAVVGGTPQPPAGRIVQPLARDPDDRRRVVVAEGGAPSVTEYETRASKGGVSLVQCRLVTGRTHQIRVHLAWSGWPIVGDQTYGTPDARIGRQALHAWRLALPHPRTGVTLTLSSPPPADMRDLDLPWDTLE